MSYSFTIYDYADKYALGRTSLDKLTDYYDTVGKDWHESAFHLWASKEVVMAAVRELNLTNLKLPKCLIEDYLYLQDAYELARQQLEAYRFIELT